MGCIVARGQRGNEMASMSLKNRVEKAEREQHDTANATARLTGHRSLARRANGRHLGRDAGLMVNLARFRCDRIGQLGRPSLLRRSPSSL